MSQLIDPARCQHEGLPEPDYSKGAKETCPSCGASNDELFQNPKYISPWCKVSQQPHGEATEYCNICQGYTKRDSDGDCYWHQKTTYSEDGPSYAFEDDYGED